MENITSSTSGSGCTRGFFPFFSAYPRQYIFGKEHLLIRNVDLLGPSPGLPLLQSILKGDNISSTRTSPRHEPPSLQPSPAPAGLSRLSQPLHSHMSSSTQKMACFNRPRRAACKADRSCMQSNHPVLAASPALGACPPPPCTPASWPTPKDKDIFWALASLALLHFILLVLQLLRNLRYQKGSTTSSTTIIIPIVALEKNLAHDSHGLSSFSTSLKEQTGKEKEKAPDGHA